MFIRHAQYHIYTGSKIHTGIEVQHITLLGFILDIIHMWLLII